MHGYQVVECSDSQLQVGLLSVIQKGTNRSCRWLQDESDDDEGKDKIGSLFQKAKAIGAQQGTADDLPSSGFAGQGRTLGGSSAQVRLRTLLLLLLWQKLLRGKWEGLQEHPSCSGRACRRHGLTKNSGAVAPYCTWRKLHGFTHCIATLHACFLRALFHPTVLSCRQQQPAVGSATT